MPTSSKLKIRLIGDPILHQPGLLFPQKPSKVQKQALMSQIEQAKALLIESGGAGIAANQCTAIKQPYCFAIVGVFYEEPKHVQGVSDRYPGSSFPQARIMVNPVISSMSEDSQCFNHGCLSIPGANRCAVSSPLSIRLSYQDPHEALRKKALHMTGIEAVVLWHELMHILFGKTYMDVTFELLPLEARQQVQNLLEEELEQRQKAQEEKVDLSMGSFHISVKLNEEGLPHLDLNELQAVIPKLSNETLKGLYLRARNIR